LRFHVDELVAPVLGFGFHNANRLLVEEEDVIGGADVGGVFTDGDGRAALKLKSARDWTIQPAAVSWASIALWAICSAFWLAVGAVLGAAMIGGITCVERKV
jgi:hypothetical protein